MRPGDEPVMHLLDGSLRGVEPRGSPFPDALEGVGVAASAAASRLGPAPRWQFVAGATGGCPLANSPLPPLP